MVEHPERDPVEGQEKYRDPVEQKINNFFLAFHFVQILVTDLHVRVYVSGLATDSLELIVLPLQI